MPKILNHLTVVRDGWHNGFPSLACWRGAYWIGHAKGERHSSTVANRACLLVSTDRQRWLPAAEFRTGGAGGVGVMPVDDNTLAAFLASWTNHPDGTRSLQHAVTFSHDGYAWDKPVAIMPPKHAMFGIKRYNDLWYAMAYLHDGDRRELFLFTSPDLLHWEQRSRIGQPDERLNEADITFQSDGEAWVIARTKRPGHHAYFCSAKPPYTDWQFIDLKTRIHAPRIHPHNGKLYIAGRCLPSELGEFWPFGHSLCIWELTRGKVTPILRIPAAGDCAYCGITTDPRGRVCLAYYSMHAYYMGVIPPFKAVYPTGEPADTKGAELQYVANDIYFAELDLDS